LISNGIDEVVPAYLSEEFSYVAPEDGKVLEVNDDYMILQFKSGKKKAVNISHKQSFNSGSGFYVDNKLIPNAKANDSFKEGDVLAYHHKFFTKDIDGTVRMNIGPLAKIAVLGTYSTYEDAGVITHKMSKKLGTSLTMMQSTKINATDDVESVVKVGTEVLIGDPLIVFGLGDTGDKSVDNFLKAFQTKDDNTSALDNAKRIIRAKHSGKVVDVRMYTTKSLERLSPSLFKIFDKYFKDNIQKRRILDKYDKTNSVYKMDTVFSLPTEPLKGSTIKGQTCDILIEIYIEHKDELSVGDKSAMYSGCKQVCSEVIPEGQEPYSESRPDEEISMFVTPSALLKRMVPSVIIAATGNKVLVELKRSIAKIWNEK
jgi:DNA-directed RNA polymerase beta subunit